MIRSTLDKKREEVSGPIGGGTAAPQWSKERYLIDAPGHDEIEAKGEHEAGGKGRLESGEPRRKKQIIGSASAVESGGVDKPDPDDERQGDMRGRKQESGDRVGIGSVEAKADKTRLAEPVSHRSLALAEGNGPRSESNR